MTEQTRPSIELSSNLGYALMLQVSSAILIIGGSLVFGAPGTELVWLIIVAILYAIGFLQMFGTRYLMQREKHGILVALAIATFAYLFSAGLVFSWYVLSDQLGPLVLYSATFGINVILAILCTKIPKS